MDIRISDFLALLEVAKTSSLNQAAKNINTSPVALMNRINKLETYFGTKIFERSNKGMVLTDDGKRILETAKTVISLLSKPLTGSESACEGLVRIGATKIAGEQVFPCVIGNFKLKNPTARLILEIIDFNKIMDKLEKGEIDIAAYPKFSDKRVEKDEILIAKDRIVTIVPRDHELTKKKNVNLSGILSFPFVLYDISCELSILIDEFLKANEIEKEKLNVKILLPEPSSVIASVSEGLGLSFCPEITAKKAERAGMISIVHQKDTKKVEYAICVKRMSWNGGEAVSRFWNYLANLSKNFKGNLPCMLKIKYL